MHTGEEDEDTVYQIRAKLYVMDGSAWKERGTGALRVNVDKKRKDSAPRLVMRAEGVLRVILNVAMFSGMHIELTDKYVRTVVYEDGQARPIMIRASPCFFLRSPLKRNSLGIKALTFCVCMLKTDWKHKVCFGVARQAGAVCPYRCRQDGVKGRGQGPRCKGLARKECCMIMYAACALWLNLVILAEYMDA